MHSILLVAFMGLPGLQELLPLILIGLLLFGGKKIPELMKGMGQGVKEFKKGLEEGAPDEETKKDETSDKKPDEKSDDKAEEKKEAA